MKIITSLKNKLLQRVTREIHRENAIAAMKSYMEKDPVESWCSMSFLGDYLELYTNSLEVVKNGRHY